MRVWCHDSDNRLIRIESNNLFGNLSDSFMHSHTLDIMVDLESNHGDENNLNNENFHAYQPIRTLRDYLQPTRSSAPSCIIFPTNANNFNFKPCMISLLPKFHGFDYGNPYLHFKEFEEVCSTFHDQSCNEETIRLKLFPFSLKENAKTWLNSLRPRSIGTWQEMQTEFLKNFFPFHRTNVLKRQIMNFSQKDNETFYRCWERFKDLLNACPHNG